MKILAVIPARGGSKGIPKKNIRPFCGKPLIVHSIEAALGAPSIDRVIVSTDSEEIAAIARGAGADVPFLRPAELAQDNSKTVDCVVHLLHKLKSDEGYEPTHVMLLEPTAPLRTTEDIEKSITLLSKAGITTVVSVCKTEPLLFSKDADDRVEIAHIHPMLAKTSSRQQMSSYYNLGGGMIFIIETGVFLEEPSFFSGTLAGYEIEHWRAIDLDDPEDFVFGEIVYEHQKELKNRLKSFT
jgi:CMP-N,N'-diacetyllegionaminic acid synthase